MRLSYLDKIGKTPDLPDVFSRVIVGDEVRPEPMALQAVLLEDGGDPRPNLLIEGGDLVPSGGEPIMQLVLTAERVLVLSHHAVPLHIASRGASLEAVELFSGHKGRENLFVHGHLLQIS
jgi:hypothetical protein